MKMHHQFWLFVLGLFLGATFFLAWGINAGGVRGWSTAVAAVVVYLFLAAFGWQVYRHRAK
jgi:hypothetical protein